MKKNDNHIEEKVEETLKAFDGIERARPKPFLYTRLQVRMEEGKSDVAISGFLTPVLQRMTIALVILVLIVNIYTVARLVIIPVATNSIQTEEQEFIEEFYPSTPTLSSDLLHAR